NHLARLNEDGSLDADFDPDADNLVYAVTMQPDGKLLVGGDFTHIAGQPRNRIARLNADGSLDTSFTDPAPDRTVKHIVVQPDGKLLVTGEFLFLGAESRGLLARLNADGSVDESFDPHVNSTIRSLALQTDG